MLKMVKRFTVRSAPQEVEDKIMQLLGLDQSRNTFKIVLTLEAGQVPKLETTSYVLDVPEAQGFNVDLLCSAANTRLNAWIVASARGHMSEIHYRCREYEYSNIRRM